MAGVALGTSARASGGDELIYSVAVEDLVDVRASDPKFPLGFTMAWPAQWLKIAHQVAVGVVPRTFPYDGDGNCDAYTAGTPSLTLDAAGIGDSEDYTGCLVVMQGTARAFGEVRRIVSYVGATSVATLNRAFDVAPNAGDPYRVLVPAFFRRIALVKGENTTTGATAQFRIVWYDYPRKPDGTKRASIAAMTDKVALADLGIPAETSETVEGGSYNHQQGRATEVDGMIGFKVRLTDLISGTQSLWGCAG